MILQASEPFPLRSSLKRILLAFPVLLETLVTLLQSNPDQSFWSNDLSSDQPIRLLTDILGSGSFRTLLEDTYPQATSASTSAQLGEVKRKEKGKAKETFNPLSWLYDFATSLLPAQTGEVEEPKQEMSTTFPSVLAKIAAFGLQDLQSSRYQSTLKIAAAKVIMKVSALLLNRRHALSV